MRIFHLRLKLYGSTTWEEGEIRSRFCLRETETSRMGPETRLQTQTRLKTLTFRNRATATLVSDSCYHGEGERNTSASCCCLEHLHSDQSRETVHWGRTCEVPALDTNLRVPIYSDYQWGVWFLFVYPNCCLQQQERHSWCSNQYFSIQTHVW